MTFLQQVELAALLLLTPSILYYIWGKKLTIKLDGSTKRELILERNNANLQRRVKNHDLTVESLKDYQLKYYDMCVKHTDMKNKHKKLFDNSVELKLKVQNFLETAEKQRVKEYTNV